MGGTGNSSIDIQAREFLRSKKRSLGKGIGYEMHFARDPADLEDAEDKGWQGQKYPFGIHLIEGGDPCK